MRKNKVIQILALIALFFVLPVTVGVIFGIWENSLPAGVRSLGICALCEAAFIGYFAWMLYTAGKRSEEETKEWKEQGFSDAEIDIMRLELRRERLNDRLDRSFGIGGGKDRVFERMEIREELYDIEEKLKFLKDDVR